MKTMFESLPSLSRVSDPHAFEETVIWGFTKDEDGKKPDAHDSKESTWFASQLNFYLPFET